MTRAEAAAFNAGITLVANLAAQSAAAMRKREVLAPTRFAFATAALQAIADEAAGLVVNVPSDDSANSSEPNPT